ncbi:unnamed protein product [Owenia fusiformis]|uniref:Fucosyltransferase n=1 Tax=Owenia fusiformis TaxID=6347 RepID=A0A8J1UZC1_OWEFU|nr:unnamed protein product [Owenia fusiformis]
MTLCFKKRTYQFGCLVIAGIALLLIVDKFLIQPLKIKLLKKKQIQESGFNKKKIAFGTTYFGDSTWFDYGSSGFDKCEFSNCTYFKNIQLADAVLFHGFDIHSRNQIQGISRPNDQIWIYYSIESPYSDPIDQSALNGIFNWTCTYRSTSDIHMPYGYVTKKSIPLSNPSEIFLSKKTKLAVIASSHCGTIPSGRWEYIAELQKYMSIDVFGKCGKTPTCGRFDCVQQFAKEYKFYLSFENAKCKEYITEKLFLNAYLSNMVPIVLGGYTRQDYERIAPPDSFIYSGDYKNASILAAYIQSLDKDDSKYLDYFKWRQYYDVTSASDNPACLLCKALHNKKLVAQKRIVNNLHNLRNKTAECLSSNSNSLMTGLNSYLYSIVTMIFFAMGICSYIITDRWN